MGQWVNGYKYPRTQESAGEHPVAGAPLVRILDRIGTHDPPIAEPTHAHRTQHVVGVGDVKDVRATVREERTLLAGRLKLHEGPHCPQSSFDPFFAIEFSDDGGIQRIPVQVVEAQGDRGGFIRALLDVTAEPRLEVVSEIGDFR